MRAGLHTYALGLCSQAPMVLMAVAAARECLGQPVRTCVTPHGPLSRLMVTSRAAYPQGICTTTC